MAADKLKKLEARGRAAFLEGDINLATRYFIQALEKKNSCDNSKSTSPKQKREKPRSKSLLSLNNNNDEGHAWILQANEKRNKINEKQCGKKKKEDKESSIEMLDGIITDADTVPEMVKKVEPKPNSFSFLEVKEESRILHRKSLEVESCTGKTFTIQMFPNYPMGYLRKASALILLNEWEEARRTYTTGLQHCSECGLLKSAMYNLEKTHKITACASNLDTKQLSDLINQNNSLPPTIASPYPAPTRRNKFRFQGQKRLTKKNFPRGTDAFSAISQIQTTSFRRRNSSSTDTHL